MLAFFDQTILLPLSGALFINNWLYIYLECNDIAPIIGCSASTEFNDNYKCSNTYAGNTTSSYWQTVYEDTLPWIQIDFVQEYNLRQLKILQTAMSTYRFKDIVVEFSGGSNSRSRLGDLNDWVTVSLPNNTRSRFVKITRETGWGSSSLGYTGISKIQALGCRPGNIQILHRDAGINWNYRWVYRML